LPHRKESDLTGDTEDREEKREESKIRLSSDFEGQSPHLG
jgi:hypothetical protein